MVDLMREKELRNIFELVAEKRATVTDASFAWRRLCEEGVGARRCAVEAGWRRILAVT